MSPRSAEFLEAAHRRLELARRTTDVDPGGAVSAAYYAMLYAARAALSERDLYAKTHAGLWNLFYETFVKPGDFDAQLLAAARDWQREREQADYEAWLGSELEAVAAVELGERFIAAVEERFA